MNSQTQQIAWTAKDHRDFAISIFEAGMSNSSPAVLLHNMPNIDGRVVTSERVKSRLQKYRANRKRNREDFLAAYDDWMHRAMSLIAHLNVPRHIHPTANDWRAHNIHLIIQLRNLMNPANHSLGELAAYLSFSAMMHEKTLRRSECTFAQTSFRTMIAQDNRVNELRHQPLGTFLAYQSVVYPELTEEEKFSPLGLGLESTKQLVSAIKALVSNQRQGQSHQSKIRCDQNDSDAQKYKGFSSHHQQTLYKAQTSETCIKQSTHAYTSQAFSGYVDSQSEASVSPQTSRLLEAVADAAAAMPALYVPPDGEDGYSRLSREASEDDSCRKRRRGGASSMPMYAPMLHGETLQSSHSSEDHGLLYSSQSGNDSSAHQYHSDTYNSVDAALTSEEFDPYGTPASYAERWGRHRMQNRDEQGREELVQSPFRGDGHALNWQSRFAVAMHRGAPWSQSGRVDTVYRNRQQDDSYKRDDGTIAPVDENDSAHVWDPPPTR